METHNKTRRHHVLPNPLSVNIIDLGKQFVFVMLTPVLFCNLIAQYDSFMEVQTMVLDSLVPRPSYMCEKNVWCSERLYRMGWGRSPI